MWNGKAPMAFSIVRNASCSRSGGQSTAKSTSDVGVKRPLAREPITQARRPMASRSRNALSASETARDLRSPARRRKSDSKADALSGIEDFIVGPQLRIYLAV